MADLDSLIGCKISLISHQDIRYDGTLFSINQAESSLVLKDVQAFGTENRVTDASKAVPAIAQVLPFVTFPGQEIKDLYVHDDVAPAPAPAPAAAPAPVPAPAPAAEHKPKHEHKPRPHKTETAHPPKPPQERESKPAAAVAVTAPVAVPAAAPAPAPKTATHNKPAVHNVGTGSHLLRMREKKTGDVSAAQVNAQGEFNFEAALKTFNKEELQTQAAETSKYVKDDFFDNFSSGAKEDGKKNRLTSSEERQLNQDTFGAIALTGGYRRGGRGRGRGGGRGGRGGGQGRGRGEPRTPAAAQA